MRFSIRDVLWLTVVAAVGAGWWADRQRLWREVEHHRQTVDAFKEAGVDVDELLTAVQNFRLASGPSSVIVPAPRGTKGLTPGSAPPSQ